MAHSYRQQPPEWLAPLSWEPALAVLLADLAMVAVLLSVQLEAHFQADEA